jgi:hypothetical protein
MMIDFPREALPRITQTPYDRIDLAQTSTNVSVDQRERRQSAEPAREDVCEEGSPSMKMEEIELRKKYRYIWEDELPYFATVERKQGGRALITLGDRINKDGDPDVVVHSLKGKLQWVKPDELQEL